LSRPTTLTGPRPGDESATELTSYVGREHELAAARRFLADSALVTLVGPGGVGKTRLAGRVMGLAREQFTDGAIFVGLAELRDGRLLANTVADGLGLHDQSSRAAIQVVVDHLRDKHFLLVLDNCEHLVDAAAAFVTEVLGQCPDVAILATSRQSLRVDGEQLLPVPPLRVPEADTGSAASLTAYDSVRLFLDRAATVLPGFTVTEDNSVDLARLCRELEGLPLAIELAAVRLRALSLRQITERLTSRLSLLTLGKRTSPSRQQTLRGLIDWSYELCSEPERLLWARVSVFSGGFDLAAAEQVCGGADVDREAVLDLIDSLLDKSILIRGESDGSVRYGMLETLREYGHDRLAGSGDLPRVARLHRDWCTALAMRYWAEWIGPGQETAVARLRREHANLRVALDYCVSTSGDAGRAVTICVALDTYWTIRGFLAEARFWMAKALDVLAPEAPERSAALVLDAFCALHQGELEQSKATLVAAERATTSAKHAVTTGYLVLMRGMADLNTYHEARARDRFATALTTFRATGYRQGEFYAAYLHGLATGLAGAPEEGRALLKHAIAASEEIGEIFWRSYAQWGLGIIEALHGDADAAQQSALTALRLAQIVDNRLGEAVNVTLLAGIAQRRQDYVTTATLSGFSDALWADLGLNPDNYGVFGTIRRTGLDDAQAALPPGEFDALAAQGRALPRLDGLRYALGEPLATPAPLTNPLTKRETEIAALIAEGLTNRQIATKLYIAPRTADTHVDHILTKLQFRSRAQVAAWLVSTHTNNS
jgi:non-specific serine/threonine protein kinase